MSKLKRIVDLISGVFLFSVLWALLIVAKTLLKSNENHNRLYIPEQVNFAIRIDGRELAEETLFSIFIESKDEQVLELMRELLREQSESDRKFDNLGIDYLSDVIFFQVLIKNKPVYGFLFNVSNPGLFKKGFEKMNGAIACHEDVGVVLLDEMRAPLGKETLSVFAEEMLEKTSESSDKYDLMYSDHGTFFETYLNGKVFSESSIFGKSTLHFGMQEHALSLNGKLELKYRQPKKITYSIQPKGFHFTGTQIPTLVQDSLENWFRQFNIKTPFIRSLSLNLLGAKLISHSSGFLVVPQMELYVETKTTFDIREVLENEKVKHYFNYQLDSNFLTVQHQRLYFEQLSEQSFYLGITQNPKITSKKTNQLMVIDGSLNPLTKIEGGRLVRAFLELIPEYRASKELVNHIDYTHIELKQTNSKYAKLSGKLVFKHGYHPMNELIKFLLIGEFIR